MLNWNMFHSQVLLMILCVFFRERSADRSRSFIRAGGRVGPDGVPAAQVLHPPVSVQRDAQKATTPPSPPPTADSQLHTHRGH